MFFLFRIFLALNGRSKNKTWSFEENYRSIWQNLRIIPHIIKPGRIIATLQGSPLPNKSISSREWTPISCVTWSLPRNTTLARPKSPRRLPHKKISLVYHVLCTFGLFKMLRYWNERYITKTIFIQVCVTRFSVENV